MFGVIEFVDDLPGRAPTSSEDIEAFAAALRLQPDRWAVYPWSDELAPKTLSSRASDINRSRSTAPSALRSGFEAAVRGGVLYVRYTGDPQ